MFRNYIIQAAAFLAQAQAGSDLFSSNMRKRALDKWENSKQLPRKQKKLMRKDAMLDLSFAKCNEDVWNNMFKF